MKTANFPLAAMYNGKFPFEVGVNDWLISITDFGNKVQPTPIPFQRVYEFAFEDTNDEYSAASMTVMQAISMAHIIKDARDFRCNVWVHCHAGICRSGAVVQLLIDLGWTFEPNSISPVRNPNTLVYNMLRKQFPELEQSWD